MAWTVVVTKSGDGFREELEASRGCPERVSLWVGAVGSEKHRQIVCDRELDIASFPEGVEARHVNVALYSLLPGEVIQMPQPLHLRPALGELRFEPETTGERTVDGVVCLCLTHGGNGLLHGKIKTVTPRRPNIITFERRCAGEDDVGTPCCWRPPRLVYDDGFGFLPGVQQAINILNLVERVAPTPVDTPDVRIGSPRA